MKTAKITPQEYFNKIKSLRNPDEIKVLCEELTSSMFNETDKPKTRVNKLTPYNNLINEYYEGIINKDTKEIIKPGHQNELIEGENAYIQIKADGKSWKRHLHFRFSGIESTNFNGKDGINTKTVVLDRLEHQKEVDVNQYLETTLRLLQSDDYNELAVGLVAASGRRPYEIWVQGKFSNCGQLPDYLKHGYFVNFKGQAKKRDYDVPEDEKIEYRIGTLIESEYFVKAFNRLRKSSRAKELKNEVLQLLKKGEIETVVEKTISDSVTPQMRRVIAREFSFLPIREGDKEINNKTLRAVYTCLITERDCPRSISSLLWASRSIGHFIDTTNVTDAKLMALLTTLGYSDYYATTSVPFVSVPVKAKTESVVTVRAFKEDFDHIKTLQTKWNLPNQQSVITQLVKKSDELETLQKQLMDTQAKLQQASEQVNQLQKQLQEQVAMNTQAQPQTEPVTKDSLRAMIVEILAEMQPQQIQPVVQPVSTPSLSPTPSTSPTPTPSTRKPKEVEQIDYELLNNDELKKLRGEGAVDEKIRRAFVAITNYNDAQPSNDTRWAITNQSLRQLCGCNGQKVADWMERYQTSINDHNNKYQFKFTVTKDGKSVCLQNKDKGDITQVIK